MRHIKIHTIYSSKQLIGIMTTRKCKECNIEKDNDHFEITTKDGKCRRAVCKPCYNHKKAERARVSSKLVDKSSIPKPMQCVACKKSSDQVDFKWRADIKQGGWRSECNTCYNEKGYSEKSRTLSREKDPEEYLRKNAVTHLNWAHNNQDKVKEQQQKTLSDPIRRFKTIVSYVRSKHGDENMDKMIDLDDAEKMQLKLSQPCCYCGHEPINGGHLNGLDRVDPRGKYDDSNTVPCCGTCNGMKLTFDTNEFLQGVRDIVLFRGKVDCDVRPCALGGTTERKEFIKDKSDELDLMTKLELWSGNCYLCGRSPAFGIDRVNPMRNYTPDNCKSCCTLCNYMKKDWFEKVFLAHITRIYNHTSQWVIGDTRNILNCVTGVRKPVAPVDENGNMIIIFPSASCANDRIGGKSRRIEDSIHKGIKYKGYCWKYVNIFEYKKQRIDKVVCKDVLSRFHNY